MSAVLHCSFNIAAGCSTYSKFNRRSAVQTATQLTRFDFAQDGVKPFFVIVNFCSMLHKNLLNFMDLFKAFGEFYCHLYAVFTDFMKTTS